MTEMEHLDIRTVTLGLSLLDCATDSIENTAARVREKIESVAASLVSTVDQIGDEIGIRVANKRIAVTPVSILTEGARGNPVDLGRAIDEAAGAVGVDFIGGYSALVHKGFTRNESDFLDSIPEALASTTRLCGSINAATICPGRGSGPCSNTAMSPSQMCFPIMESPTTRNANVFRVGLNPVLATSTEMQPSGCCSRSLENPAGIEP